MTSQPPSSSEAEPDDVRDPAPGRSALARLLAIFGWVVLLLTFAGTATIFGIRWHYTRNLAPADHMLIDRLLHEPLHFPPEWAEVQPYSKELLECLDRADRETSIFTSAFEEDFFNTKTGGVLGRLLVADPGAEEDWTSLALILSSTTALVQETSRAVSFEDYSFVAAPPGLRPPTILRVRQPAYIMSATALQHARSGHWEEACDCLEIALKLFRRHPSAGWALWASISKPVVMQTVTLFAVRCPNPKLHRRLLHLMNELRPELYSNFLQDQLGVLDALFRLRTYKQAGYPVDLASGRPSAFYIDQSYQASRDFPTWMLERLAPNNSLRPAYLGLTTEESPTGYPRHLDVLHRAILPEHWYASFCYSSGSGKFTIRTAQACYDLTRLLLATEICRLEGRPAPTSSADLVPEFLPTDPLDPFTSGSASPFLRHPTENRFYSVGPDGVDEGLRRQCDILFDPEAGGDILLPYRKNSAATPRP